MTEVLKALGPFFFYAVVGIFAQNAVFTRALGVSRPTVSQYVSGRIQPTLAMLSRLCKCLNCSADDILGVH